VFDIARFVALGWSLVLAARARGLGRIACLVALIYVVALEWASGIAVRDEGPLEPAVSMLLIFLGPSALPRGHLAGWPLAPLVIRWPAVVDVVACGLLFGMSHLLSRRASRLPARDEAVIVQVGREATALTWCAVLQLLSVFLRELPAVLGGDLFDGRLGLHGP
jgi:hypothetical protein